MPNMIKAPNLVFIRGAGDLASGVGARLFRSGFKVVMSEVSKPSSIRREVSFAEAIYDGEKKIEGICAKKANSLDEVKEILRAGNIPLVIDENNEFCSLLKPQIVVDAIIAKKNLGTLKNMANIVLCLGPGFCAGVDCDGVIETSRGHDLGRVIYKGFAKQNTGIPGAIAGVTKQRVIYSKTAGILKNIAKIGDFVKQGDILAYVGKDEIRATIDGVLRGLLRDGYEVSEHFKIADIDPRADEQKNCFSISDKARSLGGSVLEAILHLSLKKNLSQ